MKHGECELSRNGIKQDSPLSFILGDKCTWLASGGFVGCRRVKTQRIISKKASRAGSSRV
jgi:hypothetical protein